MKKIDREKARQVQQEIDVAELGDCYLRNWGRMIAAQPWPGPKGWQSHPIFRQIKSAYPEEHDGPLSFIEDDANITGDIIYYAVQEPRKLAALHCYYVDQTTCKSVEMALAKFNHWLEADLSQFKFREIVRDVKVQIGAAHQYHMHDLVDLELMREIAINNKTLGVS